MQMLPEREAKAITSQMFDGLAYLNSPSRRVIHYDLKPANILFDQLGQVKITVGVVLMCASGIYTSGKGMLLITFVS